MEKEDIQRVFSKDINSKVAVQGNEIKHMQQDMDDMKADIEEIKKSLADIHKVLSEARGGWKTLMWAAGAGSAVTAFIIMIQQIFWGK
jgi:prefoldin subunit 5|tara:strand:+ start:100 stop:363 length:264 start_codon:yes stop_codon:yes gene_type:complete